MRKSVEQVRAEIAEEREKIRAKVMPEIEAHWRELEERQAQDAAESRAIVEVGRERAAARHAREAAPVSTSPEEDTSMAVNTPTTTDTAPFSKEQQLHRAQPGQKKSSAASRIKAETKAVTDRAAAKKNGRKASAPRPHSAAGQARAKAASNGSTPKVSKYDAEAKKKGVAIKVWNKGSLADPKHIEVIYYAQLVGSRSWAMPDRFETLAAAKKACAAAGYPVKEEPKK